MSVAIETFECSETAHEPIEAAEEAIALMEELGLAGQQELIRPKGDKPAARCPYREITKEEAFAYSVLCPTHVALERYKASPIPLRVLQVAAHAKSLGLFKSLEVWDRESVEIKDPVLVAIAENKERYWERTTYILARWGEELETFSVLLKRAINAKREQFTDAVDRITGQVMAEKSRIASMSNEEIIELGATAKLELKFS